MSSEQPLLSIAIPTYNRSKYLAQLLEVLAPQLSGESRVELIISDNASPDDTQSIVESFQRDGMDCRYIKNSSNLGPDGNILQCYEKSQGRYVWIFGDDDVIVPSGVQKVLDCLSAGEYDLVYVSSHGFTGLTLPHFRSNRRFRQPEVIANVEDFVSRVNVFLTFIGGNIINKTRISTVPNDPFSSLVGTNLVQLGWIYTALRQYQKGLYIHEQLVGARGENTGGYPLFKVFGQHLHFITEKWLKIPILNRLIFNGTLQRFFPGFLLSTRCSRRSFVQEDPHKALALIFKNNYRYWIFDYPIIVLPLTLAKIWFQLLRIVNKADRIFGGIMIR